MTGFVLLIGLAGFIAFLIRADDMTTKTTLLAVWIVLGALAIILPLLTIVFPSLRFS